MVSLNDVVATIGRKDNRARKKWRVRGRGIDKPINEADTTLAAIFFSFVSVLS